MISNMLNNRREALMQDALNKFFELPAWRWRYELIFFRVGPSAGFVHQVPLQSKWCVCIISITHFCGFWILSYLSLHAFLSQTMFKASLQEPSGFSLFKKGRTSCLLVIFTRAVQFCLGLQEDCCIEENAWATKYRSIDLLHGNHSHLTHHHLK